MAKLWQTGKGGGLHPDVESFLSSLPVDARLLPEDLECSAAHAAMLGATGILPRADAELLVATLKSMSAECASGKLVVDPTSEDVHSFIEEELTRRLGDVGRSVHAGRSRNDQVAAAFRLHIVRSCDTTRMKVLDAIGAILDLARDNTGTIMPGYTHLQRAQPVTLAHHLLAWCAALERDCDRFAAARARADECPLGAGALAGSGLPTDREATARALGFARPSRNTMDAVSDRDACVDYAAAGASLMTHLSRAFEDIALWASTEYSFVTIADSASTGSSIMPQKRNPDPAELGRGKSARVLGDLQALLVLQKGLPYAYNRDLQEDKELFFDIEDTVNATLAAFGALVSSLRPRRDRMRLAVDEGFLEATDVAEFLVAKGVPFRIAYQATKALVALSADSNLRLAALPRETLASVHPVFASPDFDAKEFAAWLDIDACVARRAQVGGPSPARTAEEISRLDAFLRSQAGSA